MSAIVVLLLVVLAHVLIERRFAAVGAEFDLRLNVQVGALNVALQFVLVPTVSLFWPSPVFSIVSLPYLGGGLIFAVAMDLGEYVFHRIQHSWSWLWRMHALHHSDPNMSATTAFRHFWADPLLKAVSIWPAVFLLTGPSGAIVAGYGIIALWHIFTHSNLPVSFGRWSWLLNNPAYHRRHHSSDPADYGSNYAAIFPIFDVLAGSFRRPQGFPATGLSSKPSNIIEAVTWPAVLRRQEHGVQVATATRISSE